MSNPKAQIKKIYEEVKAEYYFPHTELRFITTEPPFFIEKGIVSINPDFMVFEQKLDEKYARSIIRHEIGHMHFCPITLKQFKQMLDWAFEEVRKNEIYNGGHSLAHLSCNTLADLIVDMTIKTKFSDDLANKIEKSIKSILQRGRKLTKFQELLIECYSLICRSQIYETKNKIAHDYAVEIMQVVLAHMSEERRVKEITRLMIKFMQDNKDNKNKNDKQGQGNESDKQGQGNESEKEQGGEGEGEIDWEKIEKELKELGIESPSFAEDAKEESLKKTIKKLDFKNKEEYDEFVKRIKEKRGIGGGIGQGSKSDDLKDYVYYQSKAIKNIEFKVKIRKLSKGKIIRGGLLRWNLSDEIEDLEVEESIREAGIAIPELTTLKYEKKVGVEEEAYETPNVFIAVDTSGSMNIEIALITTFSVVESCRANHIPVGVMLLNVVPYFVRDFTYEYDNLEDSIYNNYSDGGTNYLPAVEKLDEILKQKEKALVIFIGDFRTRELEESVEKLKEIEGKHFLVPLIIGEMFERLKLHFKLPIRIDKYEELEGAVVGAFNTYVEKMG